MLALVPGPLLYSISARDSLSAPGFFDRLQLVPVISAVLFDKLALRAIATPFRAGQGSFAQLKRWQTAHLPVCAVWTWIVVMVFQVLLELS